MRRASTEQHQQVVGTVSAEPGGYEKACSRRNQNLPVRTSVYTVKCTANERTKGSLHPAPRPLSLLYSHLSTCEPRAPTFQGYSVPTSLSLHRRLSQASPQSPLSPPGDWRHGDTSLLVCLGCGGHVWTLRMSRNPSASMDSQGQCGH